MGRDRVASQGRSVSIGALGLVSALVLAAGCTGDGDRAGEPSTTTPTTVSAAAILADLPADSLLRALALVPIDVDTSRASSIHIVHVARAADQLGVVPPPPGSDEAVLDDFYLELFGPLVQPWFDATADELEAELGFRKEQVDQYLTSPSTRGGPYEFTVALGTFDPAAVEAFVRSDPGWSDHLVVEQHTNGPYYAWGPGDPVLERPTPVRTYGYGGRLAAREDWLAWSQREVDLVRVLDAQADPSRSLAAVPWIREIAREADRAGVSRLSLDVLREPVRYVRSNWVRADMALPPIDVPAGFARGLGRWPDGGVSQTVLAYETEEDAAANLDALRASEEVLRPADVFIPTVTVERVGTLLIVTSRPGGVREALDVSRLNFREPD